MTNATSSLSLGGGTSVTVNPVTNKIYVAIQFGTVKVIGGAGNSTATVSMGRDPQFVAVNPVTNKIYVPNAGANSVRVIGGATNLTTTVNAGIAPQYVAVNRRLSVASVFQLSHGEFYAIAA